MTECAKVGSMMKERAVVLDFLSDSLFAMMFDFFFKS